MRIGDTNYTRRELESYAADLRQLADIRLMTYDDGQERGVRAAHIRTGSGLDFDVLLDRAMDIGTATYRGMALAWQSGTGAAHPARYEAGGLGWLKTFHGGMLALCGLTQAGAPNVDPLNGESLGLHGRVGAIPAYDVGIARVWLDDDTYALSLTGTVDEASLFGHRLRLTRRLTFHAGESRITIHDTVRNVGGLPAPLMILYHCNFGFPLISADTVIRSPAHTVTPRDAQAQAGIATWGTLHAPQAGYAEQVFFHDVDTSQPTVRVEIVNAGLGLTVALEFGTDTLPYLTQWKQLGFGDYTVGIEPGNCLPEGRTSAREHGRLTTLAPDESRTFTLGFEVMG